MFELYVVRLAIVLVTSVVLRYVIPVKVRNALIPLCAGWILYSESAYLTLPSFMVLPAILLNYCTIALFLNGLNFRLMNRNSTLKWFLLFWGFLLLSTLWGENSSASFVYYLYLLLDLTLAGYFLGMWIMEDVSRLERVINWMVVGGFCSLCLLVLTRGSLSVEVSSEIRSAVDMNELGTKDVAGVNVNDFAMMCVSILTVSLIKLSNKSKSIFGGKVCFCFAIFNVIVSILLIVRTGSRNAALSFIPCMWFFITSKGSASVVKKFIVLSLISIIFGVLAIKFLGTMETLRVFDYSGHTGAYGDSFDAITSGRYGAFLNWIGSMEGVDYLIGRGPVWVQYEDGMPVVWGALCIYVTIFVVTGAIGLLLLFIYLLKSFFILRRLGELGKIGLLLLSIWVFLGIGEGTGMTRGHICRLFQGMSIAFCTRLFMHRSNEPRYVFSY